VLALALTIVSLLGFLSLLTVRFGEMCLSRQTSRRLRFRSAVK
jgi:hypothetical protein